MILKTDRHIDLLVVHCTYTYKRMDIGAEEITRWHKDRGWSTCGYHFIVRKDGTIEKGRDLDRIGAHARGYNVGSIGVCYVGGRTDDNKPVDDRTPEQKKSLAALIINLQTEHPDIIVKGHNQLSSKSCPNYNVQEDEIKFAEYLFN